MRTSSKKTLGEIENAKKKNLLGTVFTTHCPVLVLRNVYVMLAEPLAG